jgi:ABC-2 type transport system permease protein
VAHEHRADDRRGLFAAREADEPLAFRDRDQPGFVHPAAFVVSAPVVIMSLGASGLLMAATFVLLRNANALANTLEYPVWLVSGILVPITVLPAWTTPIAAALPTTWAARALREATSGGPVWPSAAICAGISLICLALGAIALTHVERRARAAATLALA